MKRIRQALKCFFGFHSMKTEIERTPMGSNLIKPKGFPDRQLVSHEIACEYCGKVEFSDLYIEEIITSNDNNHALTKFRREIHT